MGKKLSGLAGGTASRAEVYGLFIAAIVLVGGGIGGAVAATGGFNQAAAPTVVVDTGTPAPTATTVSPSVVTAAPAPASAPAAPAPAPVASAVELPKATTPPLSETFIMPNIVGTSYRVSSEYLLNTIGHRGGFSTTGGCFGLAPFEIKEQSPAPGSTVNKNQVITVVFQSGMIPCVP